MLAGVRRAERRPRRRAARTHQLARLLAKQALCKCHRLLQQLVSAALDQLGQLAGSSLVVEAIATLSGPLREHG
jgi:hypothetical protein